MDSENQAAIQKFVQEKVFETVNKFTAVEWAITIAFFSVIFISFFYLARWFTCWYMKIN